MTFARKAILTTAALALNTAGLIWSANLSPANAATPSVCAKLPKPACEAKASEGCIWKATKKDGTPMSVEPHCRKTRAPKAAKAPNAG